jgi:hypothetical protein
MHVGFSTKYICVLKLLNYQRFHAAWGADSNKNVIWTDRTARPNGQYEYVLIIDRAGTSRATAAFLVK